MTAKLHMFAFCICQKKSINHPKAYNGQVKSIFIIELRGNYGMWGNIFVITRLKYMYIFNTDH